MPHQTLSAELLIPSQIRTPDTFREEPCGRDRRASKSKFKQPQLLYVFFSSLAFDILFDHFFIPFATDRSDIVPISPKLSSPKLSFYLRCLFKYSLSTYALYDLYYLPARILRQKSTQNMHMVLIIAHKIRLSKRLSCRLVRHPSGKKDSRQAGMSAPGSMHGQRGDSPLQADALRPVTKRNCVTVR